MKSYYLAIVMLLAGLLPVYAADVVTTEPSPLQESSTGVVVYFHADRGTKGLAGTQPATALYAHTGVITSESTNSSDWKHAPDWNKNLDKYKLVFVRPDLWKLDIGDIRTFYNLNPGEKVHRLAFVFRNADGSKQGKDDGGADIFVDVMEEGFQLSLSSDLDGNIITDKNNTVTFRISATSAATLSLSVNGAVVKSQEDVSTLEVPYTFADRGNYTVTASGVKGTATQSEEVSYCYPSPSVAREYPGGKPRQGTIRNADGTVTFCLAAPQKSAVMLMPAWDGYNPLDKNVMHYQDYEGNRYFWTSVDGLDPDTAYPYYYLVDGKTGVADPYAKLVLDPYNDRYINPEVYPDMPEYPSQLNNIMLAVYHENINRYDWKVNDFKGASRQDLVIYELLLRDFTGTEGRAEGNGTLRRAMERIPYLKELGVNAIELLPITEFSGNNSWGYNPNFYFAPDKAYGTPADYKAFIDLCHRNGIAVILDMVFNQSDGLHPWYQMYDKASNPFYNANAPHDYSVLNDWKQDHPLVMKQWTDCVKYWLTEYKVDGFRFDLVKGLGDNASYGDTNAYNKSRVERMAKIHAAMSEVNPDAYFINENLAGAQEENEMAADGQLNWANINSAACQYAMGYSSESGLDRFNAERDSRTWGSTVSYAESHDEERMGYKQQQWGTTGVKGNHEVSQRRIGSVHAQMILSPGAHMIWQFSELGNTQSTKDSNGKNDTSPKIVNWSALDDDDTYGLYKNVSELIHLRKQNTVLFEKDALRTQNFAQAAWADGRFLHLAKDGKELILVVNPEIAGDKTFDISGMLSTNNHDYEIVSASYNTTPVLDTDRDTIYIPANSYAVIANSKVSGIDSVTNDKAQAVKNEVYAIGADIIINGAYTSAEAFDTAGTRVPLTGLDTGIYIVRVDGTTFKVAVR